MTTEERVLRLENAFATLSEMMAQEKSRTDTLLQLVRDHDDRSEKQMGWINQLGSTQAQMETNLSALTAIVSDLGRAQTRTEDALTALVRRVDALAEMMERHVHDGHA
jgi:uncharacterized protein YukE